MTESPYTWAMPSYVLFTRASLIWGSTYWAITLQLGDIPPAVSVVYRFALASVTLFACGLAHGDRLRLPWRTQRWTLLQGFLTFGLSYVCTYNAERFVVSAFVAVLFALMVLFTPLCARIAFGTPVPAAWSWARCVNNRAMTTAWSMFWGTCMVALWCLLSGQRFTPVLSVLLSIRLEHYRPGLAEWLGMAVCLCSVACALRAPAAKPVSLTLEPIPEST